MKTTSRGFTLTEILTVLTILLALAAIIIPVVWVAQQKSHDATCKSNIRQVSLAILMYCNDNDGRYPDWNAWLSWEHSHNSPLCPDAKFPKNLVEIPAVPGYNINQRLAQGEIDGGNPSALTQGEVTFPSATVLLCEQGVGENNGLSSMANLCLVGDSCSGMTHEDKGFLRHFDGANYVFCDGHTKWYQPTDVYDNNQGNVNKKPFDGSFPTFQAH